MIDHRVYWMWLQHAFGEGSPVPWMIYNYCGGDLESFFRAGSSLWNRLPYIKERHAMALSAHALEEAQVRLEYAAKMGWGVLTPECEKYPDSFRNISNPPAVLYIKGALPNLEGSPVVAVVGSRKAREESRDAAKRISYQLAASQAIVVSGGAAGVDQAALQGALMAFGRIICIQPVDLSSEYLAGTAVLRRQVLEMGGAVISEYFSARTPGHGCFQLRNRLISGISDGVVLVQAKEKSGTMIYSRHAIEQGREVFVYPGPPGDPAFSGSQTLLEDGAIPITSGTEVLEFLSKCFRPFAPTPVHPPPSVQPLMPKAAHPPAPRLADVFQPEDVLPASTASPFLALADSGGPGPKEASRPKELLNAKQRQIVEGLDAGEQTFGQLEELTGLKAGQLMALLTELELDGHIASCSGKRYRSTKK